MISSSAAKTSASLGAICPRSGLTNAKEVTRATRNLRARVSHAPRVQERRQRGREQPPVIARHGEVVSHAQIQKRGRHQPVRGCRNPDPAREIRVAPGAPPREQKRNQFAERRRSLRARFHRGVIRALPDEMQRRQRRLHRLPPRGRRGRLGKRGDQRAVHGVEPEPRRESRRRAKEHGEFLSRRRHLQFRLERVFLLPARKIHPRARAHALSPPAASSGNALREMTASTMARSVGSAVGAAFAPRSLTRLTYAVHNGSAAITVRSSSERRCATPTGISSSIIAAAASHVALGGGAGWGSVAAAAAATAATRRHPKSS